MCNVVNTIGANFVGVTIVKLVELLFVPSKAGSILMVTVLAGSSLLWVYCPSFGRVAMSEEAFASYCAEQNSKGIKPVTCEGYEVKDLLGNPIFLVDSFNYVVKSEKVGKQVERLARSGLITRKFRCSI